MTREEFDKTVLAMRAEGVALTMPNLMLRTELPRGVIEDWLEDLDRIERKAQREAKPSGKTPPHTPISPNSSSHAKARQKTLGEELDELRRSLFEEAAARIVDKKLGWEHPKAPPNETHRAKDLRWALGLGLLLGPFGLFYSAPFVVAAIASALYAVTTAALLFVPGLGLMLLFYLLPPTHFICAMATAAYAWRYNRAGSRSALFPRAKIPGRRPPSP